MRGKFIVLEGGEGAGKTSVAAFLKARLADVPIVFTREPGGTPLAEHIRSVMISKEAANASAETQLGLIFASRFDHTQNKILPAIESGSHCISERFDSSTYAYQIFGQEAPRLKPLFDEWRKLLYILPDHYIFLDVPPKVGLKRMRDNLKKVEPIDQFEARTLSFHERVRDGLVEFMKDEPHTAIDATLPLAEVGERALEVVRKLIGRG